MRRCGTLRGLVLALAQSGQDADHIAVNEIGVSAFLCGDWVLVFQSTDIIGGHPAVLAGNGVAFHT